MKKKSFKNYAIVSCGTLYPELNFLKRVRFLDTQKIFYTTPGRHEVPAELESKLIKKINLARKYTNKIIVVYGGKYCYINIKEPNKSIDTIIKSQGNEIQRINASHCIDMLASEKQRVKITAEIANDKKLGGLPRDG